MQFFISCSFALICDLNSSYECMDGFAGLNNSANISLVDVPSLAFECQWNRTWTHNSSLPIGVCESMRLIITELKWQSLTFLGTHCTWPPPNGTLPEDTTILDWDGTLIPINSVSKVPSLCAFHLRRRSSQTVDVSCRNGMLEYPGVSQDTRHHLICFANNTFSEPNSTLDKCVDSKK